MKQLFLFLSFIYSGLNLFSQSSEDFFSTAQNFQKQLNYKEAIRNYSKAIKVNKKNALAFYEKGRCFYELENYRKAENNFIKCLKIDKCNAKAYYYIGLCYLKVEYSQDAIEYFSYAIYCDSLNFLYYYNRGYALCQVKGNYKLAKIDFLKATFLNPTDLPSQYFLTYCCYQLQDYTNTINEAQKTIALNGFKPNAYYYSGMSYFKLKDYQNACEDLTKAKSYGYPIKKSFLKRICKKNNKHFSK